MEDEPGLLSDTDQGGYFANSSNGTLTFPISFSQQACTPLVCSQWGDEAVYGTYFKVASLTKSSMKTESQRVPYYWICIGQ